MSSSRKVRSFGVEDLFALNQMLKGKHNPLRESVQNSKDAEAKNILVKVRSKQIMVCDDGRGMDAESLEKYFSRLGAGNSNKRRNHRMGMKLAVIGLGREVTIQSRPADRRGKVRANQLVLAAEDHGGVIQYGPVMEGEQVVKTVDLEEDLQQWSTVVSWAYSGSPLDALRSINQRFLQIQQNIEVLNGRRTIKADGVLACMKQVCKETGVKEYESCTLYWGIRKRVTSEVQTFMDEVWEAPSLMLAYDGEVYDSRSYKQSHLLMRWGITMGHRDVIYCVVAKGEGVEYPITRDYLLNWKVEDAQEEIILDPPEQIRSLVEEATASEVIDDQATQANVRKTLEALARKNPALKALLPERAKTKTSGATGSRGTTSGGGSSSGSNGTVVAERKPRINRGLPSYDFVQGDFEEAVLYDMVSHRLQINVKSPMIKHWLKGKSGVVNARIRSDIAVQLLVGFARHVQKFGSPPEQEILESLAENNLKLLEKA